MLIAFYVVAVALRLGAGAHALVVAPGTPLPSWPRVIKQWAIVLLLVAFFQAGVRRTALQVLRVPSGSMVPAIEVGDYVLVEKLAYWKREPARGDVVLFRAPGKPNDRFLKRVVAIPGDTIEVRDGTVWLNGASARIDDASAPPAEPCSYWDRDESAGGWRTHLCQRFDEFLGNRRHALVLDMNRERHRFDPIVVPPGHVYLLGDNRDNSHDSRYFGPVPAGDVLGRAVLVLFSRGPDGVRWDRIGETIQ